MTGPQGIRSIARLRVTLALLTLSTGVAAQISQDAFTSKFVDTLEQQNAELVVERTGPLELVVRAADGTEHSAFLDNAYELYTQDTDSLDDVLDLYTTSMLESIARHETTLETTDIVPVVKDAGWLDDVTKVALEQGAKSAPDYMVRRFAGDLMIIYAEDTPSNIRYIGKTEIEEADVPDGQLPELSVRNLLEKLPQIEMHGSDGLYMVTAGGTYEASLLLVDEIWDSGNFEVKGDLVVSVPARDLLLVSGSQNTGELARLIELTNEYYGDSPYYLSKNLYVRRNGEWRPFPD